MEVLALWHAGPGDSSDLALLMQTGRVAVSEAFFPGCNNLSSAPAELRSDAPRKFSHLELQDPPSLGGLQLYLYFCSISHLGI